jgi:glycosyltransferase involved in cell wall biosynthesis
MTTGGSAVSVVIPTRNRARLLVRALESVIDQLDPPDEILVVDDGSTDETAAVVERFPGVRLIRMPPLGVSAARNRGVSIATSPFVAFLDSDDFWFPDHLERMKSAIVETGGNAVLYFSDLELPAGHGGGTAWTEARFSARSPHEVSDDPRGWTDLPFHPMMIPASVVRRDAYLEVGGSAENLACRGDTHLFFKLAGAGPFCAVTGTAGCATSDDVASITRTVASFGATYFDCTVWLYSDVLRDARSLGRSRRNTLQRRLADAHLVLSRLAFSSHEVTRGARHLTEAVRLSPTLVLRRAVSRLWLRRRRWANLATQAPLSRTPSHTPAIPPTALNTSDIMEKEPAPQTSGT